MTLAIVAIIAGFAGLVWSADQFVTGASSIAKNLGMTPILIGLTIVAFGTSAPEIIVALTASLDDSGELAVGNAIGSNLANIGLVLGITALLVPIPVAVTQLKRELPILLVVTLAAGLCIHDSKLDLFDGILFFIALAFILYKLTQSKSHQPNAEQEADVEHLPNLPVKRSWLVFLIGLGLLIISSEILVWGAKEIATTFGVSELIIGLTVVAIGTSLPELATTVASALKGHHDIALGNILGSNLFNLLAVMGVPALINQPVMDTAVFSRDYVAMTAITFLLAVILYTHQILIKHFQFNNKGSQPEHSHIARFEGALLLLAYGAYYYLLFPSMGS